MLTSSTRLHSSMASKRRRKATASPSFGLTRANWSCNSQSTRPAPSTMPDVELSGTIRAPTMPTPASARFRTSRVRDPAASTVSPPTNAHNGSFVAARNVLIAGPCRCVLLQRAPGPERRLPRCCWQCRPCRRCIHSRRRERSPRDRCRRVRSESLARRGPGWLLRCAP